MAYTTVPPEWIEAGEPTRKELFERIKDNQDFFDSQIDALTQTSKVSMFNLTLGGSLNQYTVAQINNRMPVYAAPLSAQIVEVKATLLTASTSGTFSFDILKSTNNGVSFNTLLTANVQLTGVAVGSQSGSVNFISALSQEFDQGDLIRINIAGLQANQGKVLLEIYSELA